MISLHISPRWSQLISRARTVSRWISRVLPLTTQSILLLLLSMYLILGPVRSSSDIISACLAFGLLATIVVMTLLVTLQGMHFRKRELLTLVPPDSRTLPSEQARLIAQITPLRLIPGTFLECSCDFVESGASPAVLRVFGSSSRERAVPLEIAFPHRGSWEIQGIRCAIRDITGFAVTRWTIPFQSAVLISPPSEHDSTLPLLSSAQRPGDTLTDTVNRQGDPYDIKPYHPSDGIRKIVWKAFAKSGELLARHPEASMTPEGFVTILVLARPEDDGLCAKAIAYVRALKDLKLDVLVGCEGCHERSLASDATSCEGLLIDSVWDAKRSTPESLRGDSNSILDYCAQNATRLSVRRMLIFISGSRVAITSEAEKITELALSLRARGVEPIFCLERPRSMVITAPRSLTRKALSWCVASAQVQEDHSSAEGYKAFLSNCLSKQWEVFV